MTALCYFSKDSTELKISMCERVDVFYFEQPTSERDGQHRWLFHMGFALSLLLILFALFQLLVSFPTASVVCCVLEPWLKHVGFCLIYGSLALKTWRWPFSFHTQVLEVACHHLTESYIVKSLVLECDHSRESYTWYCLLWCTKWLYLIGI